MKKFAISFLCIALAIIFGSAILVQAASNIAINKNNITSGIVSIFNLDSNNDYKLLISKDGQKYYYSAANSTDENFPLQLGNGKYEITLMERNNSGCYENIYSESIDVKLTDDKQVYLNSIQLVKWNKGMQAIKKAKELTKGISDPYKKLEAIYSYIVNNFEYDYDKAQTVKSSYIPSIDDVNAAKKGICYDYSSLCAAMLRSQGIPAKLVMGYTDNLNGYHAWNEVYNGATGKWMTIDTTYDSQLKAAGVKVSMEKDSSAYTKDKEY